MTASVLPAASTAAAAASPLGAGATASPAAAFEAMLATLFGPSAGQGAGLPAIAGGKAADATADDDKDGSSAAVDPQSASPQTQSLIAALLAAVPPPAPPAVAAPPIATGGAATAAGGGAAGPVIAAAAALAVPFPGLGKAATTDAAGPAAPSAAKDAASGAQNAAAVVAGAASLQPPAAPAAKAAQAPEPTAPPAPAAASLSQPPLAGQAVPTPDPAAADGAKLDARGARSDPPRRNPILFANAGSSAAPTTAPPSLAHAVQAAAGMAPAPGFAATAARVEAGDPRQAGDAPAVGEMRQDHAQAPAPTEAPPLTSAPTTAAPAVVLRGAPETVANLAAQILKKLDGRSTRFDVELDPAGLGRVDVRLEIGAHGRMTAAMAFDNPQAAQELRSRSGELTRALEQAGFDVSGGLSFDVAGDPGQSGRGTPQDNDANTGSAWRGRAFQAALDATADADAAPAGGLNLSRRLLAGVDIKI